MVYIPKTARDFDDEDDGLDELTDEQFKKLVLNQDGSINIDGWKKLGKSFVGRTMLVLKKEGVARNILLERPLPQGKAPIFPVRSDFGKAYVLAGSGEPRIHRVEGRLAQVPLFRVASRPMFRKDELIIMGADLAGMCAKGVAEGIRDAEDGRVLTLLKNAVENLAAWEGYRDAKWYQKKKDNPFVVENNKENYLSQVMVDESFRRIVFKKYKPHNMLVNQQDYYTLFEKTPIELIHEDLLPNGVVARYCDVNILSTSMLNCGEAYSLPAPKYLGFMPISWSLDFTPIDHPEDAEIGFVADEEIGMMIISRAVVKMIEREHTRTEKMGMKWRRFKKGVRYAIRGDDI